MYFKILPITGHWQTDGRQDNANGLSYM